MADEDGRNEETSQVTRSTNTTRSVSASSNWSHTQSTMVDNNKSYTNNRMAVPIKQEDTRSMQETIPSRGTVPDSERYGKGAGNVHPKNVSKSSPLPVGVSATSSGCGGGNSSGNIQGKRTNRKNKKGVVVYDPSDLSKPFPEDYQLYCYKYGSFLNAVILEVCKKEDAPLMETETE
uniref:Palmitoyltransferase AKR1 n=2 Tax=Lygus hesperus TaxID=30085 RepID=A0A0A9Y9K4_LYGHE